MVTVAFWNRKKAPEPSENASATLGERLRVVEFELDLLRRAYDDLDDQFRRFRSRVSKRQALDDRDSEPAPADGAGRGAPPRNGARQLALPSPAQLRAGGTWPFKG